MLKFVDYDIVFREIPNEVTLAINLSNCPYRCKGCHSPQLQTDIGCELDEKALNVLLKQYERAITCLCFMGGDANVDSLYHLADYIRKSREGKIKTAWYSGNSELPSHAMKHFDFIKMGPYIESRGALDRKGTNQRLYHIKGESLTDITSLMQPDRM